MKIEDLHKEMENQRLEFKTAFGKETVRAQGTEQRAQSRERRARTRYSNETRARKIFPDLNILESEGRKVVSIRVQEYPIKPVSCKGKYFKRVGASNHLIPTEETLC